MKTQIEKITNLNRLLDNIQVEIKTIDMDVENNTIQLTMKDHIWEAETKKDFDAFDFVDNAIVRNESDGTATVFITLKD